MQMKIVGGLVDEKPSGSHSATKLFIDMVTLYKTRRSVFYEILIQAKEERVMQVSVQDRFFAWLSARVSSAQLSEFYFVCKDIETFCMNKRILVAPLFETTDFETLQYVKNTIRTNKMFQFKYFRQLGKMKKVMEYYLAFLDENPAQKVSQVNAVQEDGVSLENTSVEEVTVTESSESVEQEEVLEIVNNNTDVENIDTIQESTTDEDVTVTENENVTSEPENITTIESAECNDEGIIWNFANERIEFEFTSPIEVSYFGERKNVKIGKMPLCISLDFYKKTILLFFVVWLDTVLLESVRSFYRVEPVLIGLAMHRKLMMDYILKLTVIRMKSSL